MNAKLKTKMRKMQPQLIGLQGSTMKLGIAYSRELGKNFDDWLREHFNLLFTAIQEAGDIKDFPTRSSIALLMLEIMQEFVINEFEFEQIIRAEEVESNNTAAREEIDSFLEDIDGKAKP